MRASCNSRIHSSAARLSLAITLAALWSMGQRPGAAAPQSWMLVVPGTDDALRISVPAPSQLSELGVDHWQLVEQQAPDHALPAMVLPFRPPVSTASTARIIATVPGRQGGGGARRFLLRTAPSHPAATFRFAAVNKDSLALFEGDRRLLVYNHGVLLKPGVPADRARSTYVHPLFGLEGEILTDDFPRDHYHHRGLFWAWPHVRVGNKEHDLWAIKGVHQRFEKWLAQQAGSAAAVLGVQNGWYVADRKVMDEQVWLTAYPAQTDEQALDLEFAWTPVGEAVTLAGAEGKSYGGLTLRFAPRTNTVITTRLGNSDQDLPMTRLPWADLSASFLGATRPSGAAIFIGPDHPDYPPMWLTRHYGVLCVGWPGIEPQSFRPAETVRCSYRVWIHRGAPDQPGVQRAYDAYRTARRVKLETMP